MTINISSVNLNYGEVQILKNIDFKIQPGKVVSIVGPNRAGKSSLLDVISGNVEPSSGEIFFWLGEGQLHRSYSPAKSQVGELIPKGLDDYIKISNFILSVNQRTIETSRPSR